MEFPAKVLYNHFMVILRLAVTRGEVSIYYTGEEAKTKSIYRLEVSLG
jgi:hypothetical protein